MARPGAILIQLNPARISAPAWNDELPELFRFETRPYGYRYERIRDWLQTGGLSYHSTWTINRPEFFDDPIELYRRLSWGFSEEEVPTYVEIATPAGAHLRPVCHRGWYCRTPRAVFVDERCRQMK